MQNFFQPVAKSLEIIDSGFSENDTIIDLREELFSGDWWALSIKGIIPGTIKRFRLINSFQTTVFDTQNELENISTPFTVLAEKKVDGLTTITFLSLHPIIPNLILYSKSAIFLNGVPSRIILNGSEEGRISISSLIVWNFGKDTPISSVII